MVSEYLRKHQNSKDSRSLRSSRHLIWLTFLTYETEFVLFLAMLENSVLLMGWDSSHATLKVTSELQISELTSFLHHHEKHRITFEKGRYAT